MRNAAGNPQGTAIFKPVRIGGTGFITGLSISANGATKVCRTDVFNGYVKGAADTIWRALFTAASLPVGEYLNSAGYSAPSSGILGNSPWGCYEAVVAPSDPTRIYATFNTRLYRSENTATSWTKTALPDTKLWSNNGADRLFGKRIAVDNQNPDVFLLGTHADGLYYSTDKGATMTQVVIGTNTGANPNPHLVACDPISTITGSIRQRWFAVLQGSGVFVSTTGPGGPYTLMAGSPIDACDMKFDVNGKCWLTRISGAQNLWSCAAGGTTWVQTTNLPVNPFVTVAINPLNASRIVLADADGNLAVSSDGGVTWLGGTGVYSPTFPVGSGTINERAYSIPWLKLGNGVKNFPSHLVFDPVVDNKLWLAEGLGVRWCMAATVYANAPAGRFDWTEETEGIEELVAIHVCTPPGSGAVIFNGEDKPVWRTTNPDVSPRGYPPSAFLATVADVEHGYDTAYAADDPTWIAYLINWAGQWSGFSTDGGITNARFPASPPSNGLGGCLAVGNAGTVIICYSNNGQPVYTKNGGTTWATLPFPNLQANGVENGLGFFFRVNRSIITYDAGNSAFLIYNYGRNANSTGEAGLYESVDQGDTWTKVFSGHIATNDTWWVKMRAVPGQAGHLFFTSGKDYTDPLKRSTDRGRTWTTVANVTGVTDYGFGAPAPGKSYPSIIMFGSVSGVLGVWRSDDNCASWVKLSNAWPNNSLDEVRVCGADLNKYGRGYVGFAGSGFVYFDYDDKATLA